MILTIVKEEIHSKIFLNKLREIVKEETVAKKKRTAVQLTTEGREVMGIFYKRNKTLKFNRRDYRTDSNLLAKIYGAKAVEDRMKQLDKMTECKMTIVNPTQLREKWDYEAFKKVEKIKSITTI